MRFESTIYQAWSDTLLDLLRALPAALTTVVLVGHGPGLPDLAERLNRVSGDGPPGKLQAPAPSPSFAVLRVLGRARSGNAALTAYEAPRG